MTLPANPCVRVVVLNYDGGEMTLDCLRALEATAWPADRFEIVLVDNGSVDDVAERVRVEFPLVRLLEPMANLGFAGGCNLGMKAVGHYDAVALINNDAFVDPGWLSPLVEQLGAGERVGAASSKMLFEGRYHQVVVETPDAQKVRRDPRRLGVRVTGVRLDGVRVDDAVSSDEGFHAPEPPAPASGEEMARWSGARGALRLRSDGRPHSTISLRLSSIARRRVRLTGLGEPLDVIVDREPRWFDVPIAEPFDVINNVGSCLFTGGFGGDRGFLEPDIGQYQAPAEVFAWCGGAVLLRKDYLNDVGFFDERFFLYYEDTDLSWRGRLAGWSYMYAPTSIVRHRHSASSGGVGSPLFHFYTERNRFLVLIKNAPWRITLRAFAVSARQLAAFVVADLALPPLRGRRPHLRRIRPILGIARAIAKLAPEIVLERRRSRRGRTREDVYRWVVSKSGMA